MSAVNVLIVEDRKMARDCMEGYIKEGSHYRLVASISNAGMAEMACMKYDIDLILMDVCTENDENGIEACAVIKQHYPTIKIIIVTSMADVDFITKAREAGADSYWYKEAGEYELLDVMDRNMDGESVYPDKTPTVQIGSALSSEFTPGEIDVLRLLVKGLPDAEIAEELNISVPAVRWHLRQMFEKTGYNNRVTLACDVINKDFIARGL